MADDDLGGRVLVLERVTEDHGKEIKEIHDKVNDHDLCVAGFPEIIRTLKNLDNWRISQEASTKLKKPFWETKWGDRLWAIIVGAACVLGTLMWAIAMHINFGG